MTDRKAVIKNADMSEDMQQDAVDCATQAMEKYNIEKDIAAYIKKVRGRCALTSPARGAIPIRRVSFDAAHLFLVAKSESMQSGWCRR